MTKHDSGDTACVEHVPGRVYNRALHRCSICRQNGSEDSPKCPLCGIYQDYDEPIHAENCPTQSGPYSPTKETP